MSDKFYFTLKIQQNKIVTLFSCFLDYIAIIFVLQFLKYYPMTRYGFKQLYRIPNALQGLNALLMKGIFVKDRNYYEDFIENNPWW